MIRYTLLAIFVVFIAFYAWRNWYRALCACVVLMAFVERPDFPKAIMEIPGLNPWNICMGLVICAWVVNYKRERLCWDAPKWASKFLLILFCVVVIAFLRMYADPEPIFEYRALVRSRPITRSDLVMDLLINSLKWVIPGILMFVGCRSRDRLIFGLGTVLLTASLIGLQIIKLMPLGQLFSGDELSTRAIRVLGRDIGYHRVDLATMMSATSCAFFAILPAMQHRWQKSAVIFCGGLMLLALLLTGGRAGYVGWFGIVCFLGYLRWKKALLIGPLVLLVAIILVPAAKERLLEGVIEDGANDQVSSRFDDEALFGDGGQDYYAITSGRIIAWPKVTQAIADAPMIGYGRLGMQRAGVARELVYQYGPGIGFGHPHNGYLQLLLDNGIFGLLPLMFFVVVLARCASLFRGSKVPIVIAASGIGVCFIVGQLIAAIGAQSFYPKESSVLLWCVIGLTLRTYVEATKKKTDVT